jgi:predicted TIM-barrel fold metal-dependent hydrolase
MGGLHLPCASENKMLAILRRCGVKHIVCSAHDALLADPEEGNRAMQAAIDRNRRWLSGYWAVNPNHPRLAKRAPGDLAKSRGFVGFKLLPDYHAYPLTGDRYCPALEYADAHRRLVLAHTWGGSACDSPQMLETVAHKYHGATFLMGHSGYGDWDTSLRVARDLPNVYLELTAVYAAHDFAMQPSGSGTPAALMSCLQVNGIIERMVEVAGSRKIVFGTDLPWYSPHFVAGTILFARISEEARHDILHRNAERLLRQP